MAMAGAYILAKRLSEIQDYQEAFAAYKAPLGPHMTKIQASAMTAAQFVAGKNFLPYGVINVFI
jgi:2-polyprenyl-6-methoxyphenol hydroxylase-like FAD-dependent oxidoreductase